jgi:hypothetical protein
MSTANTAKSPTSPPSISSATVPEAQRFDSIESIGRDAWNACFTHEPETYDYLLAIERANIPGFTRRYYAIMHGPTLLAAMPAFLTDYHLATTADGILKKILRALNIKFRLACLGSAETEHCLIAMHPSQTPQQKRQHFAQLLDCFASDTKPALLACKDINAPDNALFADTLAGHGFHGVPGMPSAITHIDFASTDDYMARFSSATRKDMRRKLRKQPGIRIEYRTNIDDALPQIHAMYMETRSRSDDQFEELTPEFFRGMMECEGSLCALYYASETLIGANLMLATHDRLLDKFFCMHEATGRDYNLYFVSWFANLQLCLERKFTWYQSGQASYETKRRLGCQFLENRMYFRHRNPLMNRLLRMLAPLLAFDSGN